MLKAFFIEEKNCTEGKEKAIVKSSERKTQEEWDSTTVFHSKQPGVLSLVWKVAVSCSKS